MHPNQFGPPAPAPRKGNKVALGCGIATAIGVVLTVFITIVGMIANERKPASSRDKAAGPIPSARPSAPRQQAAQAPEKTAAPTTRTVVYEVTGEGSRRTVTWTSKGGYSQDGGSRLPWKKTVAMPLRGYLSLTAQHGGGNGKITCTIKVDGKVVVTNTSEGPYSVVSCHDSSY